MKKALLIILSLIMAMSLSACITISIGDVSDMPGADSDSGAVEIPQEEPIKEPEKPSVTIEEAVLVDEEGIKITAKSIETNGLFGPEVKLLFENNSGKDLVFQCRDVSINGYMVSDMMSVTVANGKKANDSLTFMESDLEACGIETIADIELRFHTSDSTSWEIYHETEMIQIRTSAADTFEYVYDDSGNLVYKGNDIRVVVKGLSEDDFLGPGIKVYIENNGDKDIGVQTRNVSINGFMVEGIFSSEVCAGKRTIDTITFFSSELEENEITSIEEVELSFHLYDADTWNTVADTEAISILF